MEECGSKTGKSSVQIWAKIEPEEMRRLCLS